MIGEAVSFADIIQDGIEDNQELFIKIDLLFPVDRLGINRAVFADDGSRGGYGFRPMNAVVTGMDVLQDEEDKILVVLVEVDERQQDIEECVVDLSVTFTEARYFLVIDNAVSGGIVVNLDGAVNPDRELIDEVFLLLRKWVVLVQVDDGFWGVFAEYSFALCGVFEQYFRQNKDAIVELGIVVISNVIDADVAVNVLHGINAVQDIPDLFSLILMFFYEDSHNVFILLFSQCLYPNLAHLPFG